MGPNVGRYFSTYREYLWLKVFEFIKFIFFVNFNTKYRPLMSEGLYFHQTFTDCVSDLYKYGMPFYFVAFLVIFKNNN